MNLRVGVRTGLGHKIVAVDDMNIQISFEGTVFEEIKVQWILATFTEIFVEFGWPQLVRLVLHNLFKGQALVLLRQDG